MRTTYALTDNKEISLPTASAVKAELDDLFHRDARFWMTGSGNVFFRIRSGAHDAMLSVMHRKSHGYILTYIDKKEPKARLLVSNSGSGCRRLVSLFVGGDFFNFWDCFFIDKKSARRAIEEFCVSGACPKAVAWIDKLLAPSIPDDKLHGERY